MGFVAKQPGILSTGRMIIKGDFTMASKYSISRRSFLKAIGAGSAAVAAAGVLTACGGSSSSTASSAASTAASAAPATTELAAEQGDRS